MTLDRRRAIDAVLAAQHAVSHGLHAGSAWLQLDLTISQLKALSLLAEAPLSVGQLGDRLGIGRVAATHLVEHLVGRQLVSRSEDTLDRRRTLVRLTAAGDEVMMVLREGPRQRARNLLDQLDDDDLIALARGMQALARAATAAVRETGTGESLSTAPDGAQGSDQDSGAAGSGRPKPTR
jgi:DNA-binding MarR family transcriptional regulator